MMDGIGQRLHAMRKALRIGLQIALRIARFQHPAVVDGDGVIAARRKAGLNQGGCVVENGLPR